MSDKKMSVLVPTKAINRAHKKEFKTETYIALIPRLPAGYQIWIPESSVFSSEYGEKISELHLQTDRTYSCEAVVKPKGNTRYKLEASEIEDMFHSRMAWFIKDYYKGLEDNWKAKYAVARICYLYGDQKTFELGLIDPQGKLYPIRGLMLEDAKDSDVKYLRASQDAKFYHISEPLFKARLKTLCANLEEIAELNNAYTSVSRLEDSLDGCEDVESIAEFKANVKDIINNEYQSLISRFMELVNGIPL